MPAPIGRTSRGREAAFVNELEKEAAMITTTQLVTRARTWLLVAALTALAITNRGPARRFVCVGVRRAGRDLQPDRLPVQRSHRPAPCARRAFERSAGT